MLTDVISVIVSVTSCTSKWSMQFFESDEEQAGCGP